MSNPFLMIELLEPPVQLHTFRLIWRPEADGSFYEQDYIHTSMALAVDAWFKYWHYTPEECAEFAVIKLKRDGTFNLDQR